MKILQIVFIMCILILLIGGCSSRTNDKGISLAISPYQDIAMIVNIKNLELEKKYGITVHLQNMDWEEILTAVASSGKTVDFGFGGFTEYLTKVNNINRNSDDPLLFIYPAYIFKGGSFITFNKNIKPFTRDSVSNPVAAKEFFRYRIGAQKNSVYEMMLFSLAKRNGIDLKQLKIFDTPLNDGILATQRGSLDIAEAGLTQLTEAFKQGGKVILTMEMLGFADITGFICKKSTLDRKRKEIEKTIRMWFDCVSYVMSDLDRNSQFSLIYLREKASTKYTIEEYKAALSQEFFPLNIAETKKSIISDSGLFSYRKIADDVIEYLLQNKIVSERPPSPEFINIDENN